MKLEWKLLPFGYVEAETVRGAFSLHGDDAHSTLVIETRKGSKLIDNGSRKFCESCAQEIHDADVAALARANGYIKLEPGQVVVDAKPIIEHCEACDEEGLKVVCDGCVLRPIRDRIKEARDE